MAKQAPKLTKIQGLKHLAQVRELFDKYDYPLCVKEIDTIDNILKTTNNFPILNSTFKVLQTTFILEYNHQNNNAWIKHRTLLSKFYKKRIINTMKNNVSGLNNLHLNIKWGKLIKKRLDARKVNDSLQTMLEKGRDTNFDYAVAVSYLYLANIDGVYGRNLKDVVIWDKLSKGQNVDMEEIRKMKLTGQNGIIEYFDGIKDSEILFDGYDEHIRNAIAHSSFTVNKKMKITYMDRDIKTEIQYDDLVGKWQNLTNLDELVFFYNQIEQVNRVISDLR
ncbi:hypothetical protein [Nitrosopumilus sp. S4]